MTLQEERAPHWGRRATKFTPENVQKIKDFVVQGVSREGIAKFLDVTVGTLQVTCSKLGISLRRPNGGARLRVMSRPLPVGGPAYAGHLQSNRVSAAKFEITLRHQGREQATNLALPAADIERLGLEAELRNLSMAELMTQILLEAIRKGMIDQILGEDVTRVSQP